MGRGVNGSPVTFCIRVGADRAANGFRWVVRFVSRVRSRVRVTWRLLLSRRASESCLFYSLTVFSRRAGNEDMRPGKEPTLIRDWLPLDARRITLSSSLPVLSHTSIVNSSRRSRLVFIGDVPSASANLIFLHLALQFPYCSRVLQKKNASDEKLICPRNEQANAYYRNIWDYLSFEISAKFFISFCYLRLLSSALNQIINK